MPRNAATNRFRIRNQNASIFINGTDGAAGNALSIANNASLSPTAAVTLEIRFRPTARKAAILFDNSTLGVTNSYYLSISADGGLFWYSTIGGVAKNIIGTTTKVKFDEWNMVNATYDGAAIKLFLNGSQLAETLAATGSMGTNSGPLRIGAYYSGGTSQTFQGSISQPRVYAAGCTLAEHQDRYYRSITSAALQAALVLDLNTERGASSTSNDLSGLGNNATLGASASWTSDSPFKSRKASVNANMVKNGDFEYAPPFTAATNTSGRFIEGTAAGSTTNDLFRWFFTLGGSVTGTGQFDTSTFRSGLASLKLVCTVPNSGSSVGMCATFTTATGPSVANQALYMIPVLPNTSYTLTGYIKTSALVSNDATGAKFRVVEYSGASTSSTASNEGAYNAGTVDWTLQTINFTTAATTRFVHVFCSIQGDSTGTAWFDDIVLTPVYPEGRVPADGNLVKNFDFEVVPTFTAAQNTAGTWITGVAGGSGTNATYKWAIPSAAISAAASVRFDTTVSHNGNASIKLDVTDASGTVVVSNILNSAVGGTLGSINVLPNTSYSFSAWVKTSTVGTNGVYMDVRQFNAAGSTITTTSSNKLSGTNDWTQVTGSFTSNAAATNVCIILRNGVAGQASTAWFDDIYLAPTTNPGRVAIT